MSSKLVRRIALVGVVVLACAACSESPLHESAGPRGASGHPEEFLEEGQAPAEAAPPARNLADQPMPPLDTEEMLSWLPQDDRETVESFYRSYGDSVAAFYNKDMYEWMVRNGFPMPDEIIEATRLTDQELEARYQGGDIKAGYFLLDRIAASIAQGGEDTLEHYLLAEDLTSHGGPFSGYAYYRYHSARGQSTKALAGLAWANYLGDSRASEELMRQAARVGQEEADSVALVLAFQTLLIRAGSLNPSQLGRKDALIVHMGR